MIMRKLFTIALLACTTLFAAEATAQVKFGLKGGLNVSSMSLSNEVFDASNRAGFYVGPTLYVGLPLTGLGLDISALYDQREATVKTSYYSGEDKLKSRAINIPLNVRYGIGLGNLANLFFFAGPQVGFNVGSKENDIFDEAKGWTLKSSNFSVNVGAGVMLLNHLQISANYNIACGNTGDASLWSVAEGVTDTVLSSDVRANAWQIGLAYYF